MSIIDQVDNLFLFLNIDKKEEDYSMMLLELYNCLNENFTENSIKEKIDSIFMEENQDTQKKLWLLTFQIRNIRGGKGEKDIFFLFLKYIFQYSPIRFIYSMLKLIPEYGCWKDLIKLLEFDWVNNDIKSYLVYIIQNQLEEDEENYKVGKNISYLAKWLPREKYNKVLVKKLANSNTSCEKKNNYNLMNYRRRCSNLNRYLNTTEILMCSKNFSKINPVKIPRLCYKKYINAFLYPTVNTEDRLNCIKNFQEVIKSSGKGSIYLPLIINNNEELDEILNNNMYDLIRESYEDAIKIYESPIEKHFSFE
jgi:hypothetical protein